MMTTLNEIRKQGPCKSGWGTLLTHLGKTKADDEPLSIATILESNGLDDAIWSFCAVQGHNKEIRLFAVWCARQVEHLLTDPKSIAALRVAEAFANGKATQEQLSAAYSAAYSAAHSAYSAVHSDVHSAAHSAAYSAYSAARSAAHSAYSAARSAVHSDVHSAAYSAHSAAYSAVHSAAYSAAHSAYSAAHSAARSAQAARLLEICTATKE